MTIDNIYINQTGAYDGNAAVQQLSAAGDAEFSAALQTASNSGRVDLDAIFEAAGRRYNLSVDLLKAVAKAESSFRPHVVSPAGAMGIMQLMPGTARSLGVTDPFDPEQNIMGGARYLRQQLDRFNGDVELALAAYNAGWPRVVQHGGIPPFRETQNYVAKIMGWLGEGREFTAGMATAGSRPGGPLRDTGIAGAEAGAGSISSKDLNNMLTQMLMIKIIEMQMNSSNDDDNRRVF